MDQSIALIGFGEAGRTFATAARWGGRARGYDLKPVDFAAAGVTACATPAEALAGASLVLSLVTADQALLAARDYAPPLGQGALWCDMNSVAPDTKRAAAEAVEAAGGRYVDVAVMAPVDPARLNVPLLVSGPHAEAGASALRDAGFTNVRVVPGDVGRASSIKMIRSVMVKGIEALTAECVLAANRAGVTDEVLGSLGGDWAQKADYNLDRMLQHGLRRAAEMEEVVKTIEALGVEAVMTRGTVARQRAIGSIGAGCPDGLQDKLDIIENNKAETA